MDDIGTPSHEPFDRDAENERMARAIEERKPFDQDGDTHPLDQPREPVTVDGHVIPIKVDLGVKQETPDNALAQAIAQHFGVAPEALTGFVAAVEYTKEEGVTLSSVWSLGVPVWRLRAFAVELQRHLDSIGQ